MVIKTHPKYDNYEFDSETGKYRRIGSIEYLTGTCDTLQKYYRCSIRSKNKEEYISTSVHRALWACFNGEIEENMEIDHIDNNKLNNKLSNLQCITINENRKRRDHTFLKEIGASNFKNQKNIKSINIETNETKVFKSKNQCANYFGCSAALVYLICEQKNNMKSFQKKYRFEYSNEKVDTIIKDPRIGTKYEVKPKIIKPKIIRITKTEEEKKESHKKAMKKYIMKKRTNII